MDFAAITAAPYRDWEARFPGRRALGYLCSYVPEEIIHAAGFVPLRIVPGAAASPRADAHLQSYTCSLARGCLERSLTGELDFLAGVAFAHTCDTMQCLADVWRERGTGKWVGWMVQPVTLDSPHARSYLVAELKRFAASLEAQFGVAVTDEGLRTSIALYNVNRRLLAEMHARRNVISAVRLWQAINAAMLLPPEEFQRLAQAIVPTTGPAATRTGSVGLVLSGATLDDPSILSLIQDLGARVVGDDLCNGERYFDTLVSETGDPWEALADRYLRRVPCPCKHAGLDAREKHLLGLVRERGAQGVVFVHKKFCEPHAWDYPPLAAALQKAGIPNLLLETEATTPLGVVRTRIEAFLEMLEG
jgi:bzd-type benzoyl-CoA reductase N subunit